MAASAMPSPSGGIDRRAPSLFALDAPVQIPGRCKLFASEILIAEQRLQCAVDNSLIYLTIQEISHHLLSMVACD
jgi:hypothetical protein